MHFRSPIIIKLEPKTSDFPEFIDFKMPFGGKLRADNRWIIQSKIIPWDFIQEKYHKKFKSMKIGAPTKKARVAFCALQIKEQMKISDLEVVQQIIENPYLQYYMGYEEYSDKKPFDSSLMVYFRRRFSAQDLSAINEKMIKNKDKFLKKKKDDNNDSDNSPPKNKGKLIVDATCTPADIKYPTDLNLLNESREKAEKIIDILHAPLAGKEKKVRTYREKARRQYLNAAKNKRIRKNKLRKALGAQLRYLERDLNHIDKLIVKSNLDLLSKKDYKNLLVIHEVYRQQRVMYKNKIRSIEDRIVSISQPHIRPIVRGKVGKGTEFGAKISISYIDGYTYLDKISWNNYNEGKDLIEQIEKYKDRFKYYPEVIFCDKIYRNRENREYCNKSGIKICGPPLGRKPKEKIVEKYKESERNPVEGKFGEAKRRYSMNTIMGKLPETSESIIAMIILIMNTKKILREISLFMFQILIKLFFKIKNRLIFSES